MDILEGMILNGEIDLAFFALPMQEKPACFSVGPPNTMTSFVAACRKDIYLPRYAQRYIQIVKDFT